MGENVGKRGLTRESATAGNGRKTEDSLDSAGQAIQAEGVCRRAISFSRILPWSHESAGVGFGNAAQSVRKREIWLERLQASEWATTRPLPQRRPISPLLPPTRCHPDRAQRRGIRGCFCDLKLAKLPNRRRHDRSYFGRITFTAMFDSVLMRIG